MTRTLCLIVLTAALLRQPAAEGLELLAPNGGEIYTVDDTIRVKWRFIAGNPTTIIELSVDNGLSWRQLVARQVLFTDPNYGNYPVPIPGTVGDSTGAASTISTTCLIRIYQYANKSAEDLSDHSFTIKARTAVLPRPSGRGARVSAPADRARMVDARGRLAPAHVQSSLSVTFRHERQGIAAAR